MRENILIVEADPAQRLFMKRLAKKNPSFAAAEASDGEQALSLLNQEDNVFVVLLG